MGDDETILLPCPFCGGNIREPITKRWTNCLGDVSYSAWVECEKCNLTIETDRCGYETEESAENAAIAAWNTRAKLENVTCGQCRHSRTERHTGDEQLVCWVRGTHGEAVPEDGYCFKGEL